MSWPFPIFPLGATVRATHNQVLLVLGITYLALPGDKVRIQAQMTTCVLWAFASATTNVLATTLILIKLINARRKFASALPSGSTISTYSGVITIVVESAVPLSLFGLCYACVNASWRRDLFESRFQVITPLDGILTLLYFSFCVSGLEV